MAGSHKRFDFKLARAPSHLLLRCCAPPCLHLASSIIRPPPSPSCIALDTVSASRLLGHAMPAAAPPSTGPAQLHASIVHALNKHSAILRLPQPIASFSQLCQPGVAADLLHSSTRALLATGIPQRSTGLPASPSASHHTARQSLHALEAACSIDLSYIEPSKLLHGDATHVVYAMQIVAPAHTQHTRCAVADR